MTENKRAFSVYNLVLIAIFVALITVCTWIAVPVGAIPFTLQTFAIFVAGGILGAKRGTIAVIVYILLGIIGVPVFSGFSSGIVKFIPHTETGMTGGYIIGFIFAVIIIGIFRKISMNKEGKMKVIMMGTGMLVGYIVCMVFGTVWFWLFNPMHMGLAASISSCVIPFLIPDIIKMIVALIIVTRINKYKYF